MLHDSFSETAQNTLLTSPVPKNWGWDTSNNTVKGLPQKELNLEIP
jgi:hypothetical protein